MTDYSLCSGIKKRTGHKAEICPLRESCQRYHGVPDKRDQLWVETLFIGKECDMWMRRKEDK